MAYIPRHLEDSLLSVNQSFGSLLVSGQPGAGKTTMLQHLAAQESHGRRYVTLDDLKVRELAKNDPRLFLQRYAPPLLIDEVQHAPGLFPYIKMHIDTYHRPGDFWMASSHIYRLMRNVRESLAGRVAILNLPPLSHREMTGSPCLPFPIEKGLVASTDNWIALPPPALFKRLWLGSMPALVSNPATDWESFYPSYVSTLIERDARNLDGKMDVLKFHRFMTTIAAKATQPLDIKVLAGEASISLRVAKGWFNILETLGIVFMLSPYTSATLKNGRKTPKVYFYDTGLICHLMGWTSPEVAKYGFMGRAVLENFTISEIAKNHLNAGHASLWWLSYYKGNSHQEIHVITEKNGQTFPLTISKSTSPDKHLTRIFQDIDNAGLDRGTSTLCCLAEKPGILDDGTLIVPIGML